MSLLSDLLNLNLSDATEKVIAEYIWSVLTHLPLILLFCLVRLISLSSQSSVRSRSAVFIVVDLQFVLLSRWNRAIPGVALLVGFLLWRDTDM